MGMLKPDVVWTTLLLYGRDHKPFLNGTVIDIDYCCNN